MIKLSVATPVGEIYSGNINMAVIRSSRGEYAILKDHIPIISTIEKGYVKLKLDNEEKFIAVLNGVVEQSLNIITVVAQEAAQGNTLEEAELALEELHQKLVEENKRKARDFIISEKELHESIKKAKAGNI